MCYVASDNIYQIVSGERRFRAARLAGLTAVPCIVEDAPATAAMPARKELLVDQVVENWQRSDLNPYELSDALTELRDVHGFSQREIAGLTGKPESEVSRLLSLQKVSAEIQQEVRETADSPLSRRHLIALAQLPADEQRELAGRVREEKLTAIETERAAKTGRRSTARTLPTNVFRYATPKATVQVTFRKRGVDRVEILETLERVTQMVREQLPEE